MTKNTFKKDHPVIVIGSGLAGLLAARIIADHQNVVLLTKKKICDSNTQHSQGGIAAVWGQNDSSNLHIKDTLEAGRGLCDKTAVTALSQKSKKSIQKLIELGVFFDKDEKGEYLLGLEGAHSLPRILYAGGDATGAEIQRALARSVVKNDRVEILENSHVIEIVNDDGQVEGISYFDPKGTRVYLECDQILLSTGGAGQLYRYTSNPLTATGEGNILAYCAGAELTDLEFFQFHPTGLRLPDAPNFLISEAVRGEGAILRNKSGKAIMETVHPRKDLAPRDIVARTIFNEMNSAEDEQVYLDATAIAADKLETRFPTIFNSCLKHNIDIRKDPIPITPVAHYMIGGVISDLCGRSSLKGLYVSGEVARTGVHGANRLASNSLLECAVYSIESAKSMIEDQKQLPEIWQNTTTLNVPPTDIRITNKSELKREQLQRIMWQNVGLLRNQSDLQKTLEILGKTSFHFDGEFSPEAYEIFAMKNLGKLIALSALQREESRGSHFRSDFPDSHDSFLYSLNRVITRDRHYF